MGCVKNENGEYICVSTGSFDCCFFDLTEDQRKDKCVWSDAFSKCGYFPARSWANDRAKIAEQAQEIEKLLACLRDVDQRLDDVLRTLKSESHESQILDACDVIETALGEKIC
jgi:cytochrome P450